jgi:hypothetical protein
MDDRATVGLLEVGRMAAGSALLLAPRLAVRVWTGRAARPLDRMVARSLGGRDLALALGTLSALGRRRPLVPWLLAGALADASDTLGTLSGYPQLTRGRRGVLLASSCGAAALGLRLAFRSQGS